jgi:hypothetical protein
MRSYRDPLPPNGRSNRLTGGRFIVLGGDVSYSSISCLEWIGNGTSGSWIIVAAVVGSACAKEAQDRAYPTQSTKTFSNGSRLALLKLL